MRKSTAHNAGVASKGKSFLEYVRAKDAERPSFPGEHWLVFIAGTVLLMKAGRGGSFLSRTLMAAAGSALLGRAASGRDGVAKIARLMGGRRSIP